MILLVTGGSGYLGRAVAAVADADWEVVAASRATGCDVTDPASVAALFAAVKPTAVINAAASLGNSGGSAATSWAVNALGAGHVAAAAHAVGARLVHVSTDAVHGGRPEPYTEADEPAPTYPYGAAKAAGEAAVTVACPGAAIVRTSLIVSGGGAEPSRHEEQILALARGAAEGVLFTDEIRCPVAVDDLARAVVRLAAHNHAGVLNVAGDEALSRYELGRRVAARHGLDPDRVPAGTRAGTGLTRPGVLRMDSSRARLIGVR